MKKHINIKLVVLLELLLFIVFLILMSLCCGSKVVYFIDGPSFLAIIIVLIPGLLLMGAWKDFVKAFSVGQKKYGLMELKNIVESVNTAQKLVVYGGIISAVVGLVTVLGHIDNLELIGPNLAVAILSIFYMAFFEFLILPLKFNAVRAMNEEMDIDYEE